MRLSIIGAVLVAAASAAASGADYSRLQPQGYLSDFANVVDAGSREQIERYCAAVEKATGAQMALVTLPTLDGDPVEDVANSLFRRWGIGKKGEDTGLLLLLSIRDRRSRLEVGYGLEPVITDGYAGTVLREMRPSLRQGAYGEAMLAAAHVLGEKIAQSKGVRIDETFQPRRRIPVENELPWPFLVLLLIFVLFLFGRGGGGPWWLLPWILNSVGGRGWRGGSHGGFGGYDSGGGFGGFGGGDSGGGGASSDW
jgi:uncharacterized protein